MHRNTIFFVLFLALVVGGFVLLSPDLAPTFSQKPLASASRDVLLKNGETYDLVASAVAKELDGKKLEMLAYNGSIPGPSIHVREGDTVTIHFTNNTNMPTLLHAHGVRMENRYDGAQSVQSEIQPGESFDYVLHFSDPGIYWYHPHVREDREQNMGLYGSFVVAPQDENYWSPVDHEEVLFLSDVLIEDGALAPYSDAYVTHALMGRFGNTMLVNGETKHTIKAEPGEVHRLYVANAATVRPFNFRVAGAKMKLIGADNGRYEKETFVDAVMLHPSERAIIDVYFPSAGAYALEHAVPDGKTYDLGFVDVSGERVESFAQKEFMQLRTNEAETKRFREFKKYFKSLPDKTLRITLSSDMMKIMSHLPARAGMGGMMGGGHDHGAMSANGGMGMMGSSVPIEWEDHMGDMNTFSTSETVKWIMRDEETGKENMDIVWAFKLGDMVKVRIINDPTSMHPMQHPIHFHGNRFVVLATNGVVNDNMVWKDSAVLKTGDTVDFLLELSNKGKWLAHCHIAEHMHSGMMLEYDVL